MLGIVCLTVSTIMAVFLIAVGCFMLRTDVFITAATLIYALTMLRLTAAAFSYLSSIVAVTGAVLILGAIIAYSLVEFNNKINDLKELSRTKDRIEEQLAVLDMSSVKDSKEN